MMHRIRVGIVQNFGDPNPELEIKFGSLCTKINPLDSYKIGGARYVEMSLSELQNAITSIKEEMDKNYGLGAYRCPQCGSCISKKHIKVSTESTSSMFECFCSYECLEKYMSS